MTKNITKIAASIGGATTSVCEKCQQPNALYSTGGKMQADSLCYECLPDKYKELVNSPFGQILFGKLGEVND